MWKRSIQTDFSSNCSAAEELQKPVISGMLNLQIQTNYSANAGAAEELSKPVIREMVTISLRIEPINASQREGPGLRSLPTASTRMPTMIGNQIAKLRMGKECIDRCPRLICRRALQTGSRAPTCQ